MIGRVKAVFAYVETTKEGARAETSESQLALVAAEGRTKRYDNDLTQLDELHASRSAQGEQTFDFAFARSGTDRYQRGVPAFVCPASIAVAFPWRFSVVIDNAVQHRAASRKRRIDVLKT